MRYLLKVGRLAALLALALAMAWHQGGSAASDGGGLEVTTLSDQTPEDLVWELLGGGVGVSNVSYKGANRAAGTFSGGAGIIGFDSGVVLSSGSIRNVAGPNREDGITSVTTSDGDADLDTLTPPWKTLDSAVLEFDFVPQNDIITFQYVFASDEYNDFVGSPFNDAFGFFLNGVNVALVPGTSAGVSINTVNKGNPFGSRRNARNPEFYINNDLDDGGGALNTEMDGLTTVLTVEAPVTAGQSHHIKLAIADGGDRLIDSNIFIKSGSFIGSHAPDASDDIATTYLDTPVDIDALINDSDLDGDLLTVTSVTQGAAGRVEIRQRGTLRYTPNAGFTGTDGFSYAVEDGNGGIDTALVSVLVLPPGGQESDPRELLNADDMLRLSSYTIAYDANDSRSDAGVYTIAATFTNTSATPLTDLYFTVATLTGGNMLLNADGGAAGAGARVEAQLGRFGDAVLDPGESFTQTFEIGVSTREPFGFFVHVFGYAP